MPSPGELQHLYLAKTTFDSKLFVQNVQFYRTVQELMNM